MVILISKPQPSLVEDDLIVPSVDIIRSIVPISEPSPGKLETGAAAIFEVVDEPGKGKGMLANTNLTLNLLIDCGLEQY